MFIAVTTWVFIFPLIGVLLERLGLESNAYFAFYGAVFALIYSAAINKDSK